MTWGGPEPYYFREERIRLPKDLEIYGIEGRQAERAKRYLEELVNQLHIPDVPIYDGVIEFTMLEYEPQTSDTFLHANRGIAFWEMGSLHDLENTADDPRTLALEVANAIKMGCWEHFGSIPTLAEQLALEE